VTAPLESSVIAGILKYLRTLDECHAEKTHSGGWGNSGKPDIDACFRGRAVKLECKRTYQQQPTAIQIQNLKRWRAAGAVAEVVRSVDEVKEIIDALIAGRYEPKPL